MIPVIVLAGGPSSGKTTILEHLKVTLPELGYTAAFVPELATHMHLNGIQFKDFGYNEEKAYQFQKYLMLYQIYSEDLTRSMLEVIDKPNKVMICDRSTFCNLVYTPKKYYPRLFAEVASLSHLQARYSGYIHLQTLGYRQDGYSLDNPCRRETAEEAVKACEKGLMTYREFLPVPEILIKYDIPLDEKKYAVTKGIAHLHNKILNKK